MYIATTLHKKENTLKHTVLALLTCTTPFLLYANGAKRLPKEFYKLQMARFFHKVLPGASVKKGHTIPEISKVLRRGTIEYCESRIKKATHEKEQERNFELSCCLNPDYVFLFVMNNLEKDPAARVCLEYPYAVLECLRFTLRNELQAVCGQIELPHEHNFEMVKPDVFEYLRDKRFTSEDIDNMHLQESVNLSRVIIEECEDYQN